MLYTVELFGEIRVVVSALNRNTDICSMFERASTLKATLQGTLADAIQRPRRRQGVVMSRSDGWGVAPLK